MMKKSILRLLALLAAACFALGMLGGAALAQSKTIEVNAAEFPVAEDGAYTSMQEVAVYLSEFGKLPANFLTKRQAEALGWSSRSGNLGEVAPGMSIGGDHFGNYEGSVPDAKGRKWTECDIDSDGGYRNGLRIVFSNDGLIYYSDDHYSTFRQVVVSDEAAASEARADADVAKGESYLSADDVAAYVAQFGELPPNFLTKTKAKKLGWKANKDNLGDVAEGCAIGGSDYHDDAGALPKASGRTWKECDVNTQNGCRGTERLVYSNDGLVYFTADYQTFTKLY